MNNVFTQPSGPVAKQANKQAIARVFGIKNTEVGYLKGGMDLLNFKILYDPVSQLCFWKGSATGILNSWVIDESGLTISSSAGSFTLVQAQAGDHLSLKDGVTIANAIDWLPVDDFYLAGEIGWEGAIARAIAAGLSTGKEVRFTSSHKYDVYDVTSISLSEGQKLRINFNGAHIVLGANKAAFSFVNTLTVAVASVTSVTETSYDYSTGASTNTRVSALTAPGHGITSVGKPVRIFSDDVIPNYENTGQFCAEWFTVGAVTSDTIYAKGVLIENYATNVKVCQPSNAALSFVGDLTVSSTQTSGWNTSAINVRGFINPTVEGIWKGVDLNGPFVNFTGCYMYEIAGKIILESLKNSTADGAFGYGFNDSGCFMGHISTIGGFDTRHPFTTTTSGTSQNVVAGDDQWSVRGRSMLYRLDTLITQADVCSLDSHANAYGGSIGEVKVKDAYRGDNGGGVAVQIRGSGLTIDDIQIYSAKTGIFVSSATKTANNHVSIGRVKMQVQQGSIALNISGSETYETIVDIGTLAVDSTNNNIITCSDCELTIDTLRANLTPYTNGANIVNLGVNGKCEIRNSNLKFLAGTGHTICAHTGTGSAALMKNMRVTGGSLLNYLATSASQYDVQSEWDVILDAWTGTPFLGLPETGATAFANIRVGKTSRPISYRVLTYATAGTYAVDLASVGSASVTLRILASIAGVVIGSITKGAFPGQVLIINNNTGSASTIALSNNSAGLLTLGSAVTIPVGSSFQLFWDGSTWRRAIT